MAKFAALSFSILACVASFACSSYTTGIQQSVARADEIGAITTLRSISMAQQAYSVTHGGAFGTFPQLVEGGYLEKRFNSDAPKIKGYVLTMTVTPGSGASPDFFRCNADPGDDDAGTVGRHFYFDSASPEIKVNSTQPASAADAPYKP